ncbi:MAG: tRNA lysidine(34) synthetase TilS, partial [Candidatus Omnitrophica bacterium]|nr:tRNA lysidine(34) synthetase TilS [Candidatus Omnitrophota bacterium]
MAKRGLTYPAFLKRIKDTIKHYDMLHPGDRVLVAVSGGSDSVCLLRALRGMRKMDLEIVVGNLDHGIRKRGSKADSAFVKKLSKELGLLYAHRELNLKACKREKSSLEEKARSARYDFLGSCAKKYNCGIIATGHTLDDQAETVVMRFILGSSLKGMSGIPPVRYENGLKIIRPLIRVEKKEIIQQLHAEGWPYREDHTNRDTKYFRNS